MAALLDSKRWDVLEQDEGAERRLVEELGIAPLVARVLVARGITDIAAAREFLAPSLVRDWADPLDIPGMAEAADRVERAVRSREKIAVFGDFDVDGMTSTCLLTQALRILGGDVDPYIPHRFGEGYGLTRAALGRVIEGSHPDLIITVDNGISAGDEVAWLVSQGIDVVVTDHHEPADLVPAGVPVTDPKLVEENYSRELAGAGVALKLVFELGRRFGQPDLWWDYTDLAALGTVSDMMLLTGENRSLVAHGIDCMRDSKRPGIVALAMSAKCALTDITADNLPFTLIPRLNAAGRMGTTEAAFDLLISEDMAEATTLAAMLEETNTHRRETEGELANEAMRTLEGTYHGEQVIVVGGAGWHEGVKGIVASRIVNRYHVPAIVFSIEDGVARGSGRSVGSVDLFHAVEQCQDLLVRFGGHAGAVGVTCKEEDVDAFRARLVEVMAELPPEQFEDRGEVAALASLSELTRETIDSLDVLAPFGQGNKRPLLGIRSVFMRNRSRVGYDAKHLRFIATDGISQVPAIMFRAPDMSRAYAFDGIVDLVVDAVNETWQGRTNPKLMVQDICYHDEVTGVESGLTELCERLLALSLDSAGTVMPDAEAATRLCAMGEAERYHALRQALGLGSGLGLVGSETGEGEVRDLLSALDAGETVLAAHGVARSVSELYIANTALSRGASSLVVVPRADVVAVTRMLAERLAPVGVGVREVRAEALEALGVLAGGPQALIITPERLEALCETLTGDAARIGFVCALEATGDALTRLASTLAPLARRGVLGACCVACTETEARSLAGILHASGEWQGARACERRAAVEVADLRGLRERETLLARLVTLGTRTLVYAGTWRQATEVCSWLMRTAPSLVGHIMPYDARLAPDVRAVIERSFDEGSLRCLVCAEGVPGVEAKDVALFACPASISHLAHLTGCLGAGGTLHLVFGEREAREVEARLQVVAPERAELVTLYRTLVATAKRADTRGAFSLDQTLLCSSAHTIDATTQLTERTVAMGVSVFEELGFLHVSRVGHARTVEMVEGPRKVELERSATYLEGRTRLEDFRAFAGWLLTAGGTTIADVLASLV